MNYQQKLLEARSWPKPQYRELWKRWANAVWCGVEVQSAFAQSFEEGRRAESIRKGGHGAKPCALCGAPVIWRDYEGRGPRPIDQHGRLHACG